MEQPQCRWHHRHFDVVIGCRRPMPRAAILDAFCAHGAELLLEDQAAGAQAEPRGEDAIVGAGGPAALDVAQDDAPGLVARLVLDQLGDGVADPAEGDQAQ